MGISVHFSRLFICSPTAVRAAVHHLFYCLPACSCALLIKSILQKITRSDAIKYSNTGTRLLVYVSRVSVLRRRWTYIYWETRVVRPNLSVCDLDGDLWSAVSGEWLANKEVFRGTALFGVRFRVDALNPRLPFVIKWNGADFTIGQFTGCEDVKLVPTRVGLQGGYMVRKLQYRLKFLYR